MSVVFPQLVAVLLTSFCLICWEKPRKEALMYSYVQYVSNIFYFGFFSFKMLRHEQAEKRQKFRKKSEGFVGSNNPGAGFWLIGGDSHK